jgi:hypothetical protein
VLVLVLYAGWHRIGQSLNEPSAFYPSIGVVNTDMAKTDSGFLDERLLLILYSYKNDTLPYSGLIFGHNQISSANLHINPFDLVHDLTSLYLLQGLTFEASQAQI